ncbi:hypothetical protein ACJ72_05869 [Emergomyces africanus]|uniref:PBP domain-containing protein n=1 Tax=Emergomyces africanus TaxID=1955775 RepID=A0A1B7NSN2_9EURO|nr:hypothetical protein ACJ72_05869 [Emergomyces africanus]
MLRCVLKTLALTFLLQFATTAAHAVEAEQVYDGGFKENSTISLRIGNGGAGQSGMIAELANVFIRECVEDGAEPFRVAWYKSDTTESVDHLKTGIVDVAITYNSVAEKVAVFRGIASKSLFIWNDHFMLVGPHSNPARLDMKSDIYSMISTIFAMAESGATDPPVKFLSRFDKSATNIKESELFIAIGQVPWANPRAAWYHEYMAYPIEALNAAARLMEYTITDRGTYLSVSEKIRNLTTIYKVGTDDPDDPLLNPAHLLVGTKAQDLALANKFADWLVSAAGQSVIARFKKDGKLVYTSALRKGR